MILDTIFTVKNEHLKRLNADDAVSFFAKLLWAETRRLGIPVTAVNISSRINVADGGVDATVDADVAGGGELATPGKTIFQVKTGDYRPWQPAIIRKELFGKRKPNAKDSLGAPVRAAMDVGGRYALVCTGCDLTSPHHEAAVSGFRESFANCGYKDPRVEVFSQNQLLALLQAFPSLSLQMNGNAGGSFETYGQWSRQDQMQTAFKPGRVQVEFIAGLAGELHKQTAAVHVHIRGEAGIGKTRLALEALRPVDLAPLVVYCDRPSKIRESPLLNALLRDDNPFVVILVVDECDADTRSTLWNSLKNVGPRVKLITIYTEFEDTAGTTAIMTAPPLDVERIVEILHEYLPAAESAHRWAEFCSGSPRVAHLVGANLMNNPDDLLRLPDTVGVWDKYVVGRDVRESADVQQRIIVLRRIALFKRFGFGRPVIDEAKAVARLCQQEDSSITWSRFEVIVKQLRDRKILQGEHTLYITPKLLHIKLWVDWWDAHGDSFEFADFAEVVPQRLLDWFVEMAQYAEQSQAAQKVFKSLLNEDGLFQKSGLLKDPRGARFFLFLTDAAPAAALQSLKNTVGNWSREELLEFTTGRREVVWALERIAVWRELFPEAARLLLRLAEAETETHISNNATGVFAGLFSPGWGSVAPTEAPPEERLPVLMEALEHESRECRKVALLACDSALKSGHFSRTAGAEHQGLRRQPKLWTPKVWGEVFDAYRRVWHLMRDRLDHIPEDQQQHALDIMLNNAPGLAHMANLAGMVTDTLAEFSTKPCVDRRKIIQVVERVLHYDARDFEPSVREAWRKLHRDLVTGDYHSLALRYVGMDLLEDNFDEHGNQTDRARPILDSLARQAVAAPDLLKPELAWLVTAETQNSYRFGYSLGFCDATFALLPSLLEAQRKASESRSIVFVGGYFRALKERAEDLWEEQMDNAAADRAMRPLVPELTWRSGMTDRAAARILSLAKSGAIPTQAFRLFSYGGVIRQLPAERFLEWIEFLLGDDSQSAATSAIRLCHFYYLMGEPRLALPNELVFRVLTAPGLFSGAEYGSSPVHVDYEWSNVAGAYIDQHPERSVELAELILEHFGEDKTALGGHQPRAGELLEKVLRRFPDDLWSRIAAYLGPPIDTRAFDIYRWLREGTLALVPAEHVWKWVEEDVEKRAWYVANFVPPVFPGKPGSASAREVLVRYGSREDVRRNLIANFSTESWTGPESVHMQTKLEQLIAWKRAEANVNVLKWLDDYIVAVQHQIERARIEEEREF